MSTVGIDLGTSSVKLILIDDALNILNSVTRSYPISYPRDGWSEQNPEDWWQAVQEGLVALLSHPALRDVDRQVTSLGIAGQMHGLVALDEQGEVLRPAILWNDTRTDEETRELNERLGDLLLRETGNIAFAGFTLPKLLWVRRHEPSIDERMAHVLLPKDYLVYRLTGVFSTDVSDASGTLLLNCGKKRWSSALCRLCHVDESLLPTLHESADVVGEVDASVLPAEIRDAFRSCAVVAGAGDNAAAALSVGVLQEGTCNLSLGTSGTLFLPTDTFHVPKKPGLHSFAHASGRFHLMGVTLSAAASLKWWMEDVLQTKSYDEEQRRLAADGTNEVFFAPYLMGERSPYNDEKVRGAFFGLSSQTTRGAMTLAVMEGVAYSLRDCLRLADEMGVAVREANVVGGGSQSALWCQTLANVLRLPLLRRQGEVGPALGAALLGRAGVGNETLLELTEALPTTGEVFEPEQEAVRRYDMKYARYRRMYECLKSWGEGMDGQAD